MLSGVVVVSYVDGTTERCAGGNVFHWPAGHSVRVEDDAEVILFSPVEAHTEVMDHMLAAMAST